MPSGISCHGPHPSACNMEAIHAHLRHASRAHQAHLHHDSHTCTLEYLTHHTSHLQLDTYSSAPHQPSHMYTPAYMRTCTAPAIESHLHQASQSCTHAHLHHASQSCAPAPPQPCARCRVGIASTVVQVVSALGLLMSARVCRHRLCHGRAGAAE